MHVKHSENGSNFVAICCVGAYQASYTTLRTTICPTIRIQLNWTEMFSIAVFVQTNKKRESYWLKIVNDEGVSLQFWSNCADADAVAAADSAECKKLDKRKQIENHFICHLK